MKIHARFVMALAFIVVLASGCSMPVLKQDIPVTTNPTGARIYANGQPMGVTPATVSLERNRSHIVTLIKENYQQEDVVIERLYQKDRAYLKAIQSGINSGLFSKNPAMGVNSGMNSLSMQEETGEAYILAPQAVKVRLTPLGSAGSAPLAGQTTVNAAGGQSPPPGIAEAPSMGKREMAREVLKMGAGAALTQVPPLEKKVETSSSSRSYVTSDGTRVQEKSGSSVGLSVNPAGLIDVLDVLFK